MLIGIIALKPMTARYLAAKYGCTVHAVEIENDRHQLAVQLTERCELSTKVVHHLGDFTKLQLPRRDFHHFVSWLVFLHIEDKNALFTNCYKHLLPGKDIQTILSSPGGTFIIEDFVKLAPFTEQEKIDLEVAVACPYVPGELATLVDDCFRFHRISTVPGGSGICGYCHRRYQRRVDGLCSRTFERIQERKTEAR